MTDSDTLPRDKAVGLGGSSPMADPPVAAPAGVAMSGQDALLATKLHVPRPPPGFVPHAKRLVEALGEGAGQGPGAGVRSGGIRQDGAAGRLGRDGGQQRRRAAGATGGRWRGWAWMPVTADPARFWRYAVAALDGARPGLAGRVGPLLGPPSASSFEGLVMALINELAADPGPGEVLLVLDDYHLVDSRPVHESVARSCWRICRRACGWWCPAGLTRSLPLARLRGPRPAG